MDEPRIYILLGKKLSNEATAEDLAALERLLEDSDVGPRQLELLKKVWDGKALTDGALLEKEWEKISGKLQVQQDLEYTVNPESGTKGIVFSACRLLAAASVVAVIESNKGFRYPGAQWRKKNHITSRQYNGSPEQWQPAGLQ